MWSSAPFFAASSLQTIQHAAQNWPLVKHYGRSIRDLKGLPASLARSGSLELVLATHKRDIRKAQKLRYKVFYEEGNAIADSRGKLTRRDICPYDRICDHLLVIDHAHRTRFGRLKPKVVGTYRLLRQDVADAHFGFYTAQEFNISDLLARHKDKKFLELGRSCVHKDYRSKKTLELLWRGIWTYVQHHHIDVMIGCASLEGTQPLAHAMALSFLHHHVAATEDWRARAYAHHHYPMNLLSKEAVDARKALASLPPLIKGYLRCGAMFGDGAVIDHMFGTTDVLVVMPINQLDARYISHFSQAGAQAA